MGRRMGGASIKATSFRSLLAWVRDCKFHAKQQGWSFHIWKTMEKGSFLCDFVKYS